MIPGPGHQLQSLGNNLLLGGSNFNLLLILYSKITKIGLDPHGTPTLRKISLISTIY